MRKNTEVVLKALANGKACKRCNTVHTDGKVVKSYFTVVAVPNPKDTGHWLVTQHGEHSVTTTVQTNGLALGLEMDGKRVSRVPQSEVDAAFDELERLELV